MSKSSKKAPEPELLSIGSDPILVLAIEVPRDIPEYYRFNFVDKKKWRLVHHQTAGIGCIPRIMWIRELKPKNDSVALAMHKISAAWFGSNAGSFSHDLDEILEYRDMIKKHLKEDCRHSYDGLAEAIYPIDIGDKTLSQMTSERLPKELDNQIKFENKMAALLGAIGRWKLFILGQNSD